MAETDSGWSSPETARAYSEFTRAHSMYRDTSRDLIDAAEVGAHGNMVVDLASGTGMTSEQILAVLAADGILTAVDASGAMMAEARRTIDDHRIQWIQGRIEEVDQVIDDASIDSVVCNSAIWQSDMARTFAAVRRTLRPGGRFAFNIGRQFIAMPFTDDELHPEGPGIHEYMQAFAVIDHGHVAPRGPVRGGGPLTPDSVKDLLEGAGLRLRVAEERQYEDTFERQRDWLSVPIFTERQFPDLTYERRMDALTKAYGRLQGRAAPPPARWMIFVAERVD